jgi:hypothetical protein
MNQRINMNTAISELQSKGIIKGQILSVSSLGTARSICYEHSLRPMRIILGDHPSFWVVTPADAERLMRAGYEMAA